LKKQLAAALFVVACAAALAAPRMTWCQAPQGGVGAPPAPAAAPAAAPAPAPTAADLPLMPDVISTYGHKVDHLFYIILGITLFMMVLVYVVFGYFLVRYRYQEGRKAKFSHGNNKLEVFWTVATSAVLIWLVFVQRETWIEIKEMDYSTLKDPYLVRLFGQQFNWHFVYPKTDGKFEPSELERVFENVNPVGLKDPSADVYKTTLLVPAGRPVVMEINSLGKYDQDTHKETLPVLHSFFSPNMRLKQDLIPFHPDKVWFQVLPDKLGTYEIVCAELCGLGHYTMRADMKVLSDDDLTKELGYDWKAHPATFEIPANK
jgi:cytochrome c oxidase subunit 2